MYGMRSFFKWMLIQDKHDRDNTFLQHYVAKETTGNSKMNKDEMRSLFCSTFDEVINEIDVRFSHQNTKLYAAVSALQPENSNFLNVKMVQSLGFGRPQAEFDVATTYIAKFNGDEKTKPTTTKSFLNIVKHSRQCLLYILH